MSLPNKLQNLKVSAADVTDDISALHVVQVDSSGTIIAGGGVNSTQVSVKEILTSSGASVMDSTNASIGVTIRAGSAAGTEYTSGDVDATPSGGVVFFDNGSNTMRAVSSATPLPVTGSFSASTIVTVSTGSVRVHQSSAADLNVTVAGYSTIAAISSVSGIVTVRPSDTNWASSAGFHFDGAGSLNVAGSFSASTIVTVSTGSVRVHQSSAADLNVTVAGYSTIASISTGSVRVHQSSAADLNVTVAGYSTVMSVSTGSVRVHQSSAADLNVTVAGYSTQVAVSSVGGIVKNWIIDRDQSSQIAAVLNADPLSTTWALAVREVGGGAVVSVSTGSVRVHQSSAADLNVTVAGYSTVVSVSTGSVRVHQSSAADLNVTVAGYSTVVAVSSLSGRVAMAVQHVTDGILNAGDSTNNALRVNVVAGSAAGSTEVTVRQSTYTDLNALSRIADRDQSSQVAGVLNADPLSSVWALAVRQVGFSTASIRAVQSSAADLNVTVAGYSTVVSVSTGSVRVHQSSAADLNVTVAGYSTVVSVSTGSVRVHQSSAADLNVTVAGYSTIAAVSSVSGIVTVRGSDTNWASSAGFHFDAAGQLQVVSTASSVVVIARLVDSSATANVIETATRPVGSSAIRGIVTRPWIDQLVNDARSTAGQATATTMVSSAAADRAYVYAFSVISTIATPTRWGFYTAAGSTLWLGMVGSGSSGITGANLAVSPPAYLFRGTTGTALTFNVETTSAMHVSIAYFVST